MARRKTLLLAWLAFPLSACAADAVLLQSSIVDAAGLDFGRGASTRFAARINGGSYQQHALSSLNGISYGGHRLHVSWVWREHAGGSQYNHDLCYAYNDDDGQTWRSGAGRVGRVTGSFFVTVDTPGITVAHIAQGEGLMNQTTHYASPDGHCHVMTRHELARTAQSRYHHYWRDGTGPWRCESLSVAPGSRPKRVGEDDGTVVPGAVWNFATATDAPRR